MKDWELLLEFRGSGSEGAFEELLRRHAGMVYGTALRQLRDAHLAEDATQTVFLLLAKKAGELDERVVLGGWLYHAARFVALKVKRQSERQKVMESSMKAVEQEDERLWQEVSANLDEALAGLGEVERDAVVLRFLEQRSFRQVGEALHLSEEAAKKRVSRALGKLKVLLGRAGVTMSVGTLSALLSKRIEAALPENVIGGCLNALRNGLAPAYDLPSASTTGSAITATALKRGACVLIVSSLFWAGVRFTQTDNVRNGIRSAAVNLESPRDVKVDTTTAVSAIRSEEHSLKVRVLEAETERPILGADVIMTFRRPGTNQNVTARTDEKGEGVIAYPQAHFSDMVMFVGAPGRVAQSAMWPQAELVSLPSRYSIRLPEGHKLIGRVVDEQTNGVAGASVHFLGDGNEFTRREANAYLYETAPVTDKGGYWEADVFPAGVTWLSGYIEHPDYTSSRFETVVHPSTAETLLFVVQKGVELRGIVRNDEGEPVSGAAVTLNRHWGFGDELKTLTDSEGRFSFAQIGRGRGILFVQAPGYLRLNKEIEVVKGPADIELALKAEPNTGNAVLRGRMVTGEGGGVGWGQVRLTTVDEKVSFEPDLHRDGSFEWLHAPEGLVAVWASDRNGNDISTNFPTDGVIHEIRFRARRNILLSGNVRDAQTKSLVGNAKLTLHAVPEYRGNIQPEFLTEAYDGHFAVTVAEEKVVRPADASMRILEPGQKSSAVLMVNAAGYRKKSVELSPGTNDIAVDVELEPGKDASGQVFFANGEPCAGAEIGFRVVPGGAWMEEPGHFGAIHHASQVRTVTGADGSFRIEPPFDAKAVVAVHELGWASVPLSGGPMRIELQRWGRLEGVVMLGSQPRAHARVVIEGSAEAAVGYQFETEAGEDGRFVFPKLPGGAAQVHIVVSSGAGSVWSHPKMVEVKAGETAQVQLGGTGVQVSGCLKPTPASVDIDWAKSSIQMFPKDRIERPGRMALRSYGTFAEANGTFVIPDVEPGEYRLGASLRAKERRVDNNGNAFDGDAGYVLKEVVVGMEPLELGEIEVAVHTR